LPKSQEVVVTGSLCLLNIKVQALKHKAFFDLVATVA
jgi:hypothetical protein